MVDGFLYEMPEEYKNISLLKGRTTVDMKVKVRDNPNLNQCVFRIVLDGYSAPITAGNFVDLVQRNFYDGMEIRIADGFVVQTGDPEGPAEGFIDPSTGKPCTITLEIMVSREKVPFYGETLEATSYHSSCFSLHCTLSLSLSLEINGAFSVNNKHRSQTHTNTIVFFPNHQSYHGYLCEYHEFRVKLFSCAVELKEELKQKKEAMNVELQEMLMPVWSPSSASSFPVKCLIWMYFGHVSCDCRMFDW